jgi:hypothetical protein
MPASVPYDELPRIFQVQLHRLTQVCHGFFNRVAT